ncbi:mitochondrial protein import protein ZIM17 isoform X2 [Andrographis paniculata]|uniref:mitochondrial protein import protein ZIM17 isoform X2 n=1 Tax=Andrographis paniculata TaxID=175694 RepID=UPI0021E967FF|nr:mitochondrial protein import protein ZIM17 isoform X2 [Andrographis paniculata]
MAARRILSLLAARAPQYPSPTELSRSFHPCPNSFHRSYEQYTRTLQTVAESSVPAAENSSECESCSTNPNPGTTQTAATSENDKTAAGHRVNSNLKISARHDLVMMFTCKVCDTRSMKTACRESYEKGVVVVRCDGCNNLHLIADRLGWFGEPGSVEEFLAARGEEVKKGSAESLNLTLEDLAAA